MLRHATAITRSLLVVTILSVTLWLGGGWPAAPLGGGSVQAVIAERTFLASPYYGSRGVNSWFDHRLPNYTVDGALVDYRGIESQLAYDGHNGVDFAMSYEPVLAAAPGQVTFAGWQNPSSRMTGYGLYVEVSHVNGYKTRYAHLSAVAVSAGNRVCSGQIIGTSGSTGNSTGPHLHFEVRHENEAVDPYGWEPAWQDPWVAARGPNATSVPLWSLGREMRIGGAYQGSAMAEHQPIGTTIIDDGDSGFWASAGLTWHAAGYQGDMRYASVNTGQSAEWRPNLARSGVYDVAAYVPGIHATTWRAQFGITRPGYTQGTVMDQLGTSHTWLSLGTFPMPAGISSYVTVSSNTGYPGATPEPPSREVGIDAVRFVEVEPTEYYVPLTAKAAGMNPIGGRGRRGCSCAA